MQMISQMCARIHIEVPETTLSVMYLHCDWSTFEDSRHVTEVKASFCQSAIRAFKTELGRHGFNSYYTLPDHVLDFW